MAVSQSDSPLGHFAAPLLEQFGSELTLVREGECVRWCFADASAVVELRAENAVAATFISGPLADESSCTDVHAVYAPQKATYPLTERGATCMAEDLAAFFSGVREPRFTFVDAYVVQRSRA